jgi:hypothetical protein
MNLGPLSRPAVQMLIIRSALLAPACLPACPVTEDLERLKKIRSHRGIRHYWGYGQTSRLILLLLLARCVPPSPPFLRECTTRVPTN